MNQASTNIATKDIVVAQFIGQVSLMNQATTGCIRVMEG